MVCGNTGIVDLLTQAGAQNRRWTDDQLVAACLRADRPTVERLLAAEPGLAERTVRIPWWSGPVHQAAALNRPEAVRPGDPTPLGWARYARHHEVGAYLARLIS